MATVSRVCSHCGEHYPLESHYCAHCGNGTGDNDSGSHNASHRSSANRSPRSHQSGQGSLANEQKLHPMPLNKAVLPLLAGAAGLLVRVGWKLLQSKTVRDTALNMANNVLQSNLQGHRSTALQPKKPLLPPSERNVVSPTAVSPAVGSSAAVSPASQSRGKRTIRIRSQWAVGDANGIQRQGQSEHTIEIDN